MTTTTTTSTTTRTTTTTSPYDLTTTRMTSPVYTTTTETNYASTTSYVTTTTPPQPITTETTTTAANGFYVNDIYYTLTGETDPDTDYSDEDCIYEGSDPVPYKVYAYGDLDIDHICLISTEDGAPRYVAINYSYPQPAPQWRPKSKVTGVFPQDVRTPKKM